MITRKNSRNPSVAKTRGPKPKHYTLVKEDSPDGTRFEGTVRELTEKSGLPKATIYRLVKGESWAVEGWYIDNVVQLSRPAPRKRGPKPKGPEKVYTLQNPQTGEQVQGDKFELADHLDAKVISVIGLVLGHSNSLKGWVLSGRNVPAHLADRIKADKEIQSLVNVETGKTLSGTQAYLTAELGVSRVALRLLLTNNAGPWCRDTPEARRVVGTGLRPNGRWGGWAKFRIRHRNGTVLEGTRKEIMDQGLSPAMTRRILFGDTAEDNVWTIEVSPTPISVVRKLRAEIMADKEDKISWYNINTGEEACLTKMQFCAKHKCTRHNVRNHLSGQTGVVSDGWVAIQVPGMDVNKEAAIERAKEAWLKTVRRDLTIYTWVNVVSGEIFKATRGDLMRIKGVKRSAVDNHMCASCPIAEKWVATDGSPRLRLAGDDAIAAAKSYYRQRARNARAQKRANRHQYA